MDGNNIQKYLMEQVLKVGGTSPCESCGDYEYCAGKYGTDECTGYIGGETQENSMYNNVENKIKGYKYVLELSININNDPLDMSSADRLCICDTRDECIEEIKKSIASYEAANEKECAGITHDPYIITRLDCHIHYHCGNKSWWHSYGIFPVRYAS